MTETVEATLARIDQRLKVIEELLVPMLQKTLDKTYEGLGAHEARIMAMERSATINPSGRILYSDGDWFREVNGWGREWIEFKARAKVYRGLDRAIPTAIAVAAFALGLWQQFHGR